MATTRECFGTAYVASRSFCFKKQSAGESVYFPKPSQTHMLNYMNLPWPIYYTLVMPCWSLGNNLHFNVGCQAEHFGGVFGNETLNVIIHWVCVYVFRWPLLTSISQYCLQCERWNWRGKRRKTDRTSPKVQIGWKDENQENTFQNCHRVHMEKTPTKSPNIDTDPWIPTLTHKVRRAVTVGRESSMQFCCADEQRSDVFAGSTSTWMCHQRVNLWFPALRDLTLSDGLGSGELVPSLQRGAICCSCCLLQTLFHTCFRCITCSQYHT